MTSSRVAFVFAGGDALPPSVATAVRDEIERLRPDALVVAADSGYDRAAEAGVAVDVLVGDLDSISPDGLARARAVGTVIEVHPADKDETDLELAFDAALALGAERMVMVGGHGGRVDHLLANLLLLGSPAYRHVDVEAISAAGHLAIVHGRRTFAARPGDRCTLLPLHGSASGIRTEGLRWALDGGTLDAATPRGVSNEVTASEVQVSVESGVLLVVFPG